MAKFVFKLAALLKFREHQRGVCRQLLAEFAPRATVFVADSRKPSVIREFSVRELLPGAFTLKP